MLKKFVSIILALLMCFSVVSVTAFAGSANTLGDVSGDGKITAADARTILRYSAKLQSLDEAQTAAADIDGNGKVSASDARIALRISAKLDSIDNYVKDAPDTFDLGFDGMGKGFDIVTDNLGAFEKESDYGYQQNDALFIYLDEENNVSDILITEDCDVTIYGVGYGCMIEDAIDALKKSGFRVFDEFRAINYETGVVCYVDTAEDGITVNYINAYYDYIYLDKDLGLRLGTAIDEWFFYMPELEPATDADNVYLSEFVAVAYTENGIVYDIFIGGECEYNIYGVKCGMPVAEATALLEEITFVMDGETGYSDLFSEEVTLLIDPDSGTVAGISLVSDIDYTFNDISWLMYSDYDDVISMLPDLIQSEDESCYFNDNVTVVFDETGYVSAVTLQGECEYNVYGVTAGMDNADAVALLEDALFVMESDTLGYNSMFAECVILTYDADGKVERIELLNSDENVFVGDNDMSFYLGCDGEFLLASLPGFTFDEAAGIFTTENGGATASVDENGTIYEVTVYSDDYTVCGITEGTPADDVADMLEQYGFVMEESDVFFNIVTNTELLIGVNEDTGLVDWVTVYLLDGDYTYIDSDMGMNLGMHIDEFISVIPDIVQDEADALFYYNDYIQLLTDTEGFVWNIALTGESDYSIWLAAYGEKENSVIETISFFDFEYVSDGCYYSQTWDQYITIVSDENGDVVYLEVADGYILDNGIYNDNELIGYLYSGKDIIITDFADAVYDEENGCYVTPEGIAFTPDEYDSIFCVELTAENDYTIFGISVGMNKEEAAAATAMFGAYCYDDGSGTISIDDLFSGLKAKATYTDDGVIDYIGVIIEYYQLEDFIGKYFDYISGLFPYLEEYEQNVYYCGYFAFAFDENNVLYEAALINDSMSQIYTLWAGIDIVYAEEQLAELGYEYVDTTDGINCYYNEETDLCIFTHSEDGEVLDFISVSVNQL